jgi:polysaccharide export outer membrane protein
MHHRHFALSTAIATTVVGLSCSAAIVAGRSQPSLAQTPALPADPVIRVTPNSPQLEQAYTLGGGDRIRIEILRVPQYSGEQEVLVDGSLNLPLVGKIPVEGLTLERASQVLVEAYSAYLRQPIVTVSLVEPRPLKIGIAGEVQRPGAYTLTREGAQFPTLTRAIEIAGGITQSADLRNARIRRPQHSGPDLEIQVDLWSLLKTGDLSADLTLRDGDTIAIPTLTEIDLQEASELAAASFAAKEVPPLNIAVVGEVYRPGTHTLNSSGGAEGLPTVTQALQAAGGIKPLANIRRLQIRRPTRNGSQQIIEVDLWQLLQVGDLSQDLRLQNGDTIVVPIAREIEPSESTQLATASFSAENIRVNIVGEVKQPGGIQIPPNTPLNQALLAAGGFTNRADTDSVELIRLNPDGTISQRTIDLDFSQGLNELNNPALRNADAIVVSRSTLASISDTMDTAINPLGKLLTILNFPFRFFGLFGQ